jgi:hypothetical protein
MSLVEKPEKAPVWVSIDESPDAAACTTTVDPGRL